MEKIAIIGTGISGMGAGYLLRNDYDITFYEKNDYPGGHTNTLTVDEDGRHRERRDRRRLGLRPADVSRQQRRGVLSAQ